MTTADSTLLLADQTIWTADGYVTPISGAAAIALADASLAGAGALHISGQSAVTLEDAALTALGALEIHGSAVMPLADVLVTASGALRISGSAEIILEDLIASGVGEVETIIDLRRVLDIGRRPRVSAIGIYHRVVH